MSQQVGTIKRALSSARGMQIGMSVWPPYLAAGVRVEHIAPDFSRARVRLNKRPWNTNYVGTAFGGSLFSMADPFWMFLLMRRLGSDYVVWDVAGEIDFVSPGRTAVHGEFEVTTEQVAEIRDAAAGGEKVLRWFSADLTDDAGEVVARVRKQIYVRRTRESVAVDPVRTASDRNNATAHTAAPPHHA